MNFKVLLSPEVPGMFYLNRINTKITGNRDCSLRHVGRTLFTPKRKLSNCHGVGSYCIMRDIFGNNARSSHFSCFPHQQKQRFCLNHDCSFYSLGIWLYTCSVFLCTKDDFGNLFWIGSWMSLKVMCWKRGHQPGRWQDLQEMGEDWITGGCILDLLSLFHSLLPTLHEVSSFVPKLVTAMILCFAVGPKSVEPAHHGLYTLKLWTFELILLLKCSSYICCHRNEKTGCDKLELSFIHF